MAETASPVPAGRHAGQHRGRRRLRAADLAVLFAVADLTLMVACVVLGIVLSGHHG
jgi:hypothetical protein